MSKNKEFIYIATDEVTIENKQYHEGQEVPFANKRMIESGLVEVHIRKEPKVEENTNKEELLVDQSSDVSVETVEETDQQPKKSRKAKR